MNLNKEHLFFGPFFFALALVCLGVSYLFAQLVIAGPYDPFAQVLMYAGDAMLATYGLICLGVSFIEFGEIYQDLQHVEARG